ncbi:MAG: desulfoferrodoxin, partial [Clostridia bacterium]|nr:desulfoferrodoxin [Clostridia bacterium]
ETMGLFEPNSTDAAAEKHVPVIEVRGNTATVTVSGVRHPMTEEHHISWVMLHSDQGNQRKKLSHTGEPAAVFALAEGDRPLAVYARCNLHGLWKGQ